MVRKSGNRKRTGRMPVLFVGHGNPMNAIEENAFSRGWEKAAKRIPRPEAILCVSAHWETDGSFVTTSEKPRTIHDFYGFPDELYKARYPSPGNPALAARVIALCGDAKVGPAPDRGLDHGCWAVLKRMYPKADIPVVQLSLDRISAAPGIYNLCGMLSALREEKVLILGSGNIVHNLGLVSLKGDDFNEPYAYDWAEEAGRIFKKLVNDRKHKELIEYRSLGESARLAVPTPEHFLPLLAVLSLAGKSEDLEFFNDQAVAGSVTMTCLLVGG